MPVGHDLRVTDQVPPDARGARAGGLVSKASASSLSTSSSRLRLSPTSESGRSASSRSDNSVHDPKTAATNSTRPSAEQDPAPSPSKLRRTASTVSLLTAPAPPGRAVFVTDAVTEEDPAGDQGEAGAGARRPSALSTDIPPAEHGSAAPAAAGTPTLIVVDTPVSRSPERSPERAASIAYVRQASPDTRADAGRGAADIRLAPPGLAPKARTASSPERTRSAEPLHYPHDDPPRAAGSLTHQPSKLSFFRKVLRIPLSGNASAKPKTDSTVTDPFARSASVSYRSPHMPGSLSTASFATAGPSDPPADFSATLFTDATAAGSTLPSSQPAGPPPGHPPLPQKPPERSAADSYPMGTLKKTSGIFRRKKNQTMTASATVEGISSATYFKQLEEQQRRQQLADKQAQLERQIAEEQDELRRQAAARDAAARRPDTASPLSLPDSPPLTPGVDSAPSIGESPVRAGDVLTRCSSFERHTDILSSPAIDADEIYEAAFKNKDFGLLPSLRNGDEPALGPAEPHTSTDAGLVSDAAVAPAVAASEPTPVAGPTADGAAAAEPAAAEPAAAPTPAPVATPAEGSPAAELSEPEPVLDSDIESESGAESESSLELAPRDQLAMPFKQTMDYDDGGDGRDEHKVGSYSTSDSDDSNEQVFVDTVDVPFSRSSESLAAAAAPVPSESGGPADDAQASDDAYGDDDGHDGDHELDNDEAECAPEAAEERVRLPQAYRSLIEPEVAIEHGAFDAASQVSDGLEPALSIEHVPYDQASFDRSASFESSVRYEPSGSVEYLPVEPSVESLGSAEADSEDAFAAYEPEEIAKLIFERDQTVITDAQYTSYLGALEHGATRAAYMKFFEWRGVGILNALRSLCERLYLRGESQQVDRLLEAFSRRYCECNLQDFLTTDMVHTIAYSIFLLNTDIHMADHSTQKKMTRQQFVSNTLETISSQLACSLSLGEAYNMSGETADGTVLSTSTTASTSHTSAEQVCAKHGVGEDGCACNSSSASTSYSDYYSVNTLQYAHHSTFIPPTEAASLETLLRNIYYSVNRQALPINEHMERARVEHQDSFDSSTQLALARAGGATRTASRVFNRAKYMSFLLDSSASLQGSSSSRLSSDEYMLSPISPTDNHRYSFAPSVSSAKTGMSGLSTSDAHFSSPVGFANALSHAMIREESFLAEHACDDTSVQGKLHSVSSAGSKKVSTVSTHTEAINNSLRDDLWIAIDEELELYGPPFAKEGLLRHKCEMNHNHARAPGQAPAGHGSSKKWQETFVVVQRGYLKTFQFVSSSAAKFGYAEPVVGGGNWTENANMIDNICLQQAITCVVTPPTSRITRTAPVSRQWSITLPGGETHFFESGTPEISAEFILTCNYWAARLSKEPLGGGVSNVEYGWSRNMLGRAGGRGTVREWKAPPLNMVTNIFVTDDDEQCAAFAEHVRALEHDIAEHKAAKRDVVSVLPSRSDDKAKALVNWDRKFKYLSQEYLKYTAYTSALRQAIAARDEVAARTRAG
ncbi:uncharacterized protein V1510DRAFT_401862 [Dipodascopsis tothii]|uniref:uncharacterized protein n=1 Tax=Dipodascopsis tothii TaxID=44089 RepID=UPI0034CEF19B